MAVRDFGTLGNGTRVQQISISAGDLVVEIITFGAIIRDVRLAGITHPLVLGSDTLAGYVDYPTGLGAVMGRCANRIARGRLVIDGRTYALTKNARGGHHIHGGAVGFSRRTWRLIDHAVDSVTLALSSPDGEEGYPGAVEAVVRYAIEAPATIRMQATATTDAPTAINLAQHSYFNLDDSPDILDHEVQIFADSYTPTDDEDIPTGEVLAVAGSFFDFRASRPIRQMRAGARIVFDKNFVVARRRASRPVPHARLFSPRSGIALAVASTEPGMQFYDGAYLPAGVPGLEARVHGPNAGCCFESQIFPDAVNHAAFPSPIVRPDGTYRQTTTYAFSRQ